MGGATVGDSVGAGVSNGAQTRSITELNQYLFPPNQFTPSWRPAVRSTSRKRTFSITCWVGATRMALMTVVSPAASFGVRDFATSTARAAETASLASPLSTTWPLALLTLIFPDPVLAAIFPCSAAASSDTSRSTTATRRLSALNTEIFVVPTFLPCT